MHATSPQNALLDHATSPQNALLDHATSPQNAFLKEVMTVSYTHLRAHETG